MNRLALISIFAFFIITGESGYCQIPKFRFEKIEGANNIRLGKVNAIAQDKYGFMWFSDQINGCLVQFDGTQMIQFKKELDNPNSLGGDYPECLFADSSGILWIGYYGQGLDKFDLETGKFEHYRNDPEDPNSLNNDYVSVVFVDHLDNIWIGTNKGLNKLNRSTGKVEHFVHNSEDPKSLSHNIVRSIYEDSQGTLWVGTGFPWNRNDLGGLNKFDRTSQTFERFMHDSHNPNSLINNKVRSILEDHNGVFWIGTMKDGLHSFDRKTGEVKRHAFNPNNSNVPSRPPVKEWNDHISFLTEDADKNLWIGTIGNGINYFNTKTNTTTHFSNSNSNSQGFDDSSGWASHASEDGFVWIATQQNNLFKVDLYKNNMPFYPFEDGLQAHFEESEYVSWFGTNAGLKKIDTRKGTEEVYKSDSLDSNSLSSNHVRKIYKDSFGQLWIGTISGLNLYNKKTKNFVRYNHNVDDIKSLSGDNISSIIEDSKSNLWIGTFSEGLNVFNRKDGSFKRFQHDPNNSSSLSHNSVRAILDDNHNNLWIGVGFNGGVNRFEEKTGSFEHFLKGHHVTSIFQDSEKSIWVGTLDGLYKYNNELDDFVPFYNESKGVNIKSTIVSMVEDNLKNLWIITKSGLYKLDLEKDFLIHFGKESGVFFEDEELLLTGFAKKTSNGKLLFNQKSGFYSFFPQDLDSRMRDTKLIFRSFYLKNKKIYPGKGEILESPISETNKIELEHDQNVFGFEFSCIDYGNTEDNVTFFKLAGYDENWQEYNLGDKINYYKIPPGTYTFMAKVANSANGGWTENSIDIKIFKPWWFTWWAFSLYTIIFVVLVRYIHLIQKSRVIRIERERAQIKEIEQAKEIKKAYAELKATQSQLIQSEKMASLGELTAGIAHEIQNPMNFVNNFSELNTELLEEMKEHIENKNFNEVEDLAKDIIENEKKINHHGKRADTIVKAMLQHSRKSSGEKEMTDINSLVDEYLKLAYHGLRAKNNSFNAKIKTDFDKKVGQVKINPQDMGRVLINMITNAFYAVESKKVIADDNYKPTVAVKTDRKDNEIIISVIDNGSGISQENVKKIFQPFFTTKPTKEGTGLGLSLSYDIIKSQGGSIKVESIEGEGSEFKIILTEK